MLARRYELAERPRPISPPCLCEPGPSLFKRASHQLGTDSRAPTCVLVATALVPRGESPSVGSSIINVHRCWGRGTSEMEEAASPYSSSLCATAFSNSEIWIL
jgi:hypothetical protein